MHFGLSETQKLLQETTQRWCEKNTPPTCLKNSAGFATLQKDFDQLGLSSLLVPEDKGGADGSLLDVATVQMVLGQNVAPVRFMGTALATLALGELSTEPIALALESGGVEASGDKLPRKLNGKKVLAFDAQGAPPSSATQALVAVGDELYLAPLTAAQIKECGTIDITRTFATLTFDNTAAARLPQPASRLIAAAQILLAADMIGAADSMLAQALAYAKMREQFGRVIASFQAVKHSCAAMAANLEPCRSQLWLAAHNFDDDPQSAPLQALLTKAHVSKITRRIARDAVEIFGGFGFTDEANLHFWFKRIGASYAQLGAPEVLCARAAALQFDAA